MISKLRLEAEGTTLQEVLNDIEAATKAAKLPKELQVHDEHYERVAEGLFRGRRVFGRGPKPNGSAARPFAYQQGISVSGNNFATASSTSGVVVK